MSTGLSRMRMHYHSDTDSAATYDFIINALSPRTNFRAPMVLAFQALDEPYITALDGSLPAVLLWRRLKTCIHSGRRLGG